mgnify:CR=1 FL=1
MSRVNLGMGGFKKKTSPKKKNMKSKGSAQGVKMKSKGGAMGGKKEMMPGGVNTRTTMRNITGNFFMQW